MPRESDCYCSVQAALADCIRGATGLAERVSAYPQAGNVTMPFVTVENLGDGSVSKWAGGSTENADSRVEVFACSATEAMTLANVIRDAISRCDANTMSGKLRVVRLSHPHVGVGPETGQYVADFRVTHLTTREEPYHAAPTF